MSHVHEAEPPLKETGVCMVIDDRHLTTRTQFYPTPRGEIPMYHKLFLRGSDELRHADIYFPVGSVEAVMNDIQAQWANQRDAAYKQFVGKEKFEVGLILGFTRYQDTHTSPYGPGNFGVL